MVTALCPPNKARAEEAPRAQLDAGPPDGPPPLAQAGPHDPRAPVALSAWLSLQTAPSTFSGWWGGGRVGCRHALP